MQICQGVPGIITRATPSAPGKAVSSNPNRTASPCSGVGFGKVGSKTSDVSAGQETTAGITAAIQNNFFSADGFRERQSLALISRILLRRLPSWQSGSTGLKKVPEHYYGQGFFFLCKMTRQQMRLGVTNNVADRKNFT